MSEIHFIFEETSEGGATRPCKAGPYSSAKVHRSLIVHPDGRIVFAELTGLRPE